jgi:histidine kinase
MLSLRSDRLRSLGEMAASIAHELNQPLVGVRGLAEHLVLAVDRGWELPRESVREKANAVVAQADKMTHIIQHVRTFAREAGRVETASVDVNEVVRTTVEGFGLQLRTRGIELTCEYADGLPTVRANPFSLEEVILNLLVNARDAVQDRMKDDRRSNRVRLLTRVADEAGARRVLLEVADSGVGMSPEVLQKAFDPFFTTKAPQQGTGLGLSISRSIVEQFGGTLDIQSRRGGGATAVVSLPVEE